MKAGGSRKPASHETVDNLEHTVTQEGSTVFKFAVTNMSEVSTKLMERNNLNAKDLSWFVPHQANKRIIEAVAHRLNVPIEKVLININKFGNTTNGTLPLCLWDFQSQFKKGDKMVLSAFGGGFTWGALYMKWAY
jgi:3-oxoacyl-[acyl-carrier-protein] synthase-3